MRELYARLVRIVRRLYVSRVAGASQRADARVQHECRLVHADLSEYNILYHRGELYIIDVSQSVGTTPPPLRRGILRRVT